MPGVSDAGVSESGREKAESIKLWLPSHLDVAERDSLCSGSIITCERELRFGQLHDALNELRRARRIRRGLVTFHQVQLAGEGQKTQTRSRAVIHTVQERIDRAVRRYRVARDALLELDPSGSWQDLYHVLNDRDNRGPGKELEELSASDGRYTPSWIWLSNSNATTGDPTQSVISPDEVNEDMRVEWAQCVARADRWEEEVGLLQEEMRRVVHFLEWQSRNWISRAGARADHVTPAVRSGLSAYAHKQASIFHNLAIQFCRRWGSKLASHSLPHTWATSFLKTRGTQPASLNLGEDGPMCQDPSESPVTPPRAEPPTTNSTTPPIPTEFKISDDDDGSSSSDEDSDAGSKESDESEYEPGGW